jgi:tetratricopeptide (TPR) repeat protein
VLLGSVTTVTEPLRPRTDPETLREVDVDTAGLEARLTELEGEADVAALVERARALTLLGRLGAAEDTARRAATAAMSTGDVHEATRARVALGDVLRRRSAFEEAENELAVALAEAAQLHDDALRALALQQRGLSRFDAGRFEEAERDFTSALAASRRLGAPAYHIAQLEQGVTAAMRRLVTARER